MTKDTWGIEVIKELKSLYAQNIKCAAIAKRLTDKFPRKSFTRNAVIGKLNRLGLFRRKDALDFKKSRKHKPPEEVLPLIEAIEEASVEGCTLLELDNKRCRFPIGDPKAPKFHFCGHSVVSGPYCPTHTEKAYQKPRKALEAGEDEGGSTDKVLEELDDLIAVD